MLAIDPVVTGSENAAYCKYVGATLDEKGPGFVQGITICPTAADEFVAEGLFPLGWDIRVVFDELLNGDAVEELICDVDGDGVTDNPIETCDGTIANTRPVTLTCAGTNVPYDGYYYPNGNKESYPVGPAIYVTPDPTALTMPTGSTCTITITDVVVDKQGEHVASGADSFDLKIQDLAPYEQDPPDAEAIEDRGVLAADGAVAFTFNADLDPTSVDAAEVQVLDSAGAPLPAASVDFAVDAYYGTSDAIYVFSADAAGFAPGNYTARLTMGATFTEVNGGMLTLAAPIDVRFVVE